MDDTLTVKVDTELQSNLKVGGMAYFNERYIISHTASIVLLVAFFGFLTIVGA